MLDRILGAQRPGTGDPFPEMVEPQDIRALADAFNAAGEFGQNGPALAASDRLASQPAWPSPDLLATEETDILSSFIGTADAEALETILWNRIIPAQSFEGDGFRKTVPFNGWLSSDDFGDERAGAAGALLLARVPWWFYSQEGDTVSVNQYAPSAAVLRVGGARVRLIKVSSAGGAQRFVERRNGRAAR